MKELNLREAIGEAISEEMDRDSKVFLLGEDVGPFGGVMGQFRGLHDKYGPDRIKDTPISEDGIVGVSIGAALGGFRPVCQIMFCAFIGLAMDEVWDQATALRYVSGGQMKVPMVIETMAGISGQGDHRHSQTHEGTFMGIPGLKVVFPSTAYDGKGLMKTAIRDDSPVLFMTHPSIIKKNIKSEVPDEEYTIPLGKADIKREGSDVTVVATGYMVHKALSAAGRLEEKGINAEIVDLRSLVPLDKETVLNSVKKTGHVVIMTEDPKNGSAASIIAGMIAEEGFDYLDAPIKRVAAKDTPIPYTPPMEDFYVPQEADLIKAVNEIIK
ncbi:alpha-ketoacid dehydrogenase subunit beta [Chloroflexota bacterium]